MCGCVSIKCLANWLFLSSFRFPYSVYWVPIFLHDSFALCVWIDGWQREKGRSFCRIDKSLHLDLDHVHFPLQTALAKASRAVVDVTGVCAVVVVVLVVVVVEFSFCFLYIDIIYTHNTDRSFNIKNRMVKYSHHYLLAVEWRSCEFQMMQLNVNMVVNVRDR